MEHEQCKSYNYEHETAGSTHSCELLDQVKSEIPSDFVSRSGFTHYESVSRGIHECMFTEKLLVKVNYCRYQLWIYKGTI